MSSWNEVRRSAAEWHAELVAASHLVPATQILAAAEGMSGVKLLPCAEDDILLDGADAQYDHSGPRILYSNGLPADKANYYIAHEFGHHRLHAHLAVCSGGDFEPWTPAEPESSVVGETDAYSPKQRTEAQANLFARELLLPRSKLRLKAAEGPIDARELAGELGLPLEVVLQQMSDALLLPDEPPSAEKTALDPPDDSQWDAATAELGPVQVRAGPGTGKTRTLVERIGWLITEKSVKPNQILALTYSNDAAQDLSRRVRDALGPGCAALWVGTFHAFGLDLLRTYADAVGLEAPPRLLDQSESLFVLEELLPQLQLNHYLDLQEPLRGLKSVLNAIGRAKDELCSPQKYQELAQAIEDQTAREKALEVAHVYAVYDSVLRARGHFDFGDLIVRTNELLTADEDVKSKVRDRFPHILVDEYQDINRASALLLKQLVKPTAGPWVVGDIRQAIYRFRGASPLNMTRFGEDFPGAKTKDLEINYRSGGKIVNVFERFGRSMSCSHLCGDKVLKPNKGEHTGHVEYNVAETWQAEAERIGQLIQQRAPDLGKREHAVIGRSHTTLAKIATHLERSGVPCLYFGDFFERAEIRDCLSLISIASETEGLGLLRVAQSAHYSVPITDILKVFRWRADADVTMLTALRRVSEISDLSADGLTKLRRLADHFKGVQFTTSPHKLLIDHLFISGAAFVAPLNQDTVPGQQKRLAIYQLLQVTFNFRAPTGRDPKREFLDHVRRLEVLDEEKGLRKLPAAAAGIDAVRLITVHGSKGLEFPTVYIPSLSPSYFPPNAKPETCPPPPGLFQLDALMSPASEEESLFFVGLSRAKDSLNLSRATAYGGASRPNPSKLLTAISASLPSANATPWRDQGIQPPSFRALSGDMQATPEMNAYDIETYQTCPRRYYYEVELGLQSRTRPSPYLKFLSAIRASFTWVRALPFDTDLQVMTNQFDETWTNFGPVDHAHAELYKHQAFNMVRTARTIFAGTPLDIERTGCIGTRVVRAKADNIQMSDKGIIIQRLKASRLATKESEKARYGLLEMMVSNDHPGVPIQFEHVSLQTGDRRVQTSDRGKLLKTAEAVLSAFDGIAAGRFDPCHSDRICPTCPYYFICPTDGIVKPN